MERQAKISSRLICVTIALLTMGVPLAAQTSEGQTRLSAEAYLGQSYRFYQLGRYADSIDAARAALKQRRDYGAAWNNIAASYIGLGLWEDAVRAAEESIRLQPEDNELARNNLAWAKLNLETTPESYLARSFQYFQHGHFEETITAAQAALNLRPDYAEAWNNIGAAYNSMSRWADAVQACERALLLRPDFPLAKNNLALAKAEQAKQLSGGAR